MLQSVTAPVAEARQRTLASEVLVAGRGLLGGAMAEARILPAPADSGIVFERADLDPPVRIPATVDHSVPRARRTALREGEASIDTVEHCLSALAGLGIDNAIVRLHGPELPCGDGSAMPFVDAIVGAGIVEQDAPRRVFRIREPIVIEEGDSMIAALPSHRPGLQVVYELDYGSHSDASVARRWRSIRRSSTTAARSRRPEPSACRRRPKRCRPRGSASTSRLATCS